MVDEKTEPSAIDWELAHDFLRTDLTSLADAKQRLAMLIVRARLAGPLNPSPIAMRLPCPDCGELHLDEGAFATKPHHTHSCQKCGLTWRPAVVHTVGVRFLPGFKNP